MGRGGDGRGGGDTYRGRRTRDKWSVLDMSKRDLTDDRLRQSLPDPGPYEEINFSMNKLASEGLRMVVDLCLQSDKLRVLKLFKNTIDDRGADDLARLCAKCGTLEELHLSHNSLTVEGIGRIVRTAEKHRSDNATAPLWMRLEMNDVIDPGRYLDEIRQSSISVCFRRDEVRCNPRRCVYGCKVHLPHFEMQKSTKGKGKGKDGKDWHKSYEWEDWKKPYREPFEGSRHHQDTEARWEDHRGERRGEDRRDWNGRDWNAEEVESEHTGEYGSRRRVRKLDTQRLNLTDDMSRRDMLDPGPYEEGKGRADDWEAHGGPRRRDERWASDHLGVERRGDDRRDPRDARDSGGHAVVLTAARELEEDSRAVPSRGDQHYEVSRRSASATCHGNGEVGRPGRAHRDRSSADYRGRHDGPARLDSRSRSSRSPRRAGPAQRQQQHAELQPPSKLGPSRGSRAARPARGLAGEEAAERPRAEERRGRRRSSGGGGHTSGRRRTPRRREPAAAAPAPARRAAGGEPRAPLRPAPPTRAPPPPPTLPAAPRPPPPVGGALALAHAARSGSESDSSESSSSSSTDGPPPRGAPARRAKRGGEAATAPAAVKSAPAARAAAPAASAARAAPAASPARAPRGEPPARARGAVDLSPSPSDESGSELPLRPPPREAAAAAGPPGGGGRRPPPPPAAGPGGAAGPPRPRSAGREAQGSSPGRSRSPPAGARGAQSSVDDRLGVKERMSTLRERLEKKFAGKQGGAGPP